MSKELEYEFNNFANLLNKDCRNLMEALKKQSEDNKPILYLGKHYKKVILPYEEYQKMYSRLESIDNSEPSEALECLERIDNTLCLNNIKGKLEFGIDTEEHTDCDSVIGMTEDLDTIKQALVKAEEPKHYLKWEDLEKFKDKDSVKVKMNDTELSLIIQIDCLNDIYVQLYKEKEDGNCVNLLSDFFRNKELFNNLRLELLE